MKSIISILCICLAIPSLMRAGDIAGSNFFKGSFEEAKIIAQEEGKLFLVSFYADWCTPCNWMDETTFPDSTVQHLLNENYISFRVDIDDPEGYALKEKFALRYLPTILIFNTQSKLLLRIEETLSPVQMIQALEKYNSDENKLVIKHALNTSPLIHQNLESMLSKTEDKSEIPSSASANADQNLDKTDLLKENSTLIFLGSPLSDTSVSTDQSLEQKVENETMKQEQVQSDSRNIIIVTADQDNLIEEPSNPEESQLNEENTKTEIVDRNIGESREKVATATENELISVQDDPEISEDDQDSGLGNFEYHKKVSPKYRLQIGVFSQFKNTYSVVNDLKDKFENPVIVLNDSSNDKIIYRVFLGEFYTKDEAEDFQKMIKRKYKIDSVVK